MSEYKWQIPPDGGHMDVPDGIYFQNMTMLEVEERLKVNDVLIIPVGSTEAHGPHACYGEDTFLVTRMAEAVAKRTGCTVSQPVWFGSHPYHHLGMPGTVPVDEDRRLLEHWLSQADLAQRARSGIRHPHGHSPLWQKVPGAVNPDQPELVLCHPALRQGQGSRRAV